MSNNTARLWSFAAAIVCVMSTLAARGDAGKTTQAVWNAQKINFYYSDATGGFSCDAFKRKVTRILKALGAADAEVVIGAADCGVTSGAARKPMVSLKVRTPVEATPEVLKAAAGQQPFVATWRPVSLSRGRMGIESSDCVMIDHLKHMVLPRLGVRTVDDGLDCLPGAFSSTQPKLKVEALVAQ